MTDAPKHPIDPDPANELASDHSPIDPRDFRNALGTYATGVTIITAIAADGKPYGLTCNSFASVSLNPPLVLWSLGMFSQGLSTFQNASHFAVNVLGVSQQALAVAESTPAFAVGEEVAHQCRRYGLPAYCLAFLVQPDQALFRVQVVRREREGAAAAACRFHVQP